MPLTSILDHLAEKHVSLSHGDGLLRWRAPEGVVTEELCLLIRQQKESLSMLLNAEHPWLGQYKLLCSAARDGVLPCGSIMLKDGTNISDPAGWIQHTTMRIIAVAYDTNRCAVPKIEKQWLQEAFHLLECLSAMWQEAGWYWP